MAGGVTRDRWWWVVAMLPSLVVLALIVGYGVNVPTTDQWGLPYLFRAVANGEPWIGALWQPNNEHRVVFPRLIFVPLAFATGWNVKWEMVVSWIVATAGFLGIWGAARRSRDPAAGGWTFGLALVASSAVYFSLVQHENWLWGFQLAFFLVQGPFLTAVWVLSREDWRAGTRIGWAAALCVVATFSMVQGVFAWIVLTVAVWAVGRTWRERCLALGSWLVVGGVVIGCYFIGFTRPDTADDPNYALHHPVAAAFVTFALLGGQFGRTLGTDPVLPAAILGVLTVVAFAGALAWAAWRSVSYARIAPWLAVGLFGGLFCLAVGYGRSEGGVDRLVSVSRYMTGPPLLVIAGVQLWRVALEGRGMIGRRILGGICFLLIAMVGINSWAALGDAGERSRELRLARAVLPIVDASEEEVDAERQGPYAAIAPSLDAPYDGAAFIRSTFPLVVDVGFRKSGPGLDFSSEPGPGEFDRMIPAGGGEVKAGPVKVGPNKRLVFSGSGEADGVVLITRDEERKFRAAAMVEGSRWEVKVPAGFFGPGDWQVHAWAYDSDSGALRELAGSPRRLIVREAVNPKKRKNE